MNKTDTTSVYSLRIYTTSSVYLQLRHFHLCLCCVFWLNGHEYIQFIFFLNNCLTGETLFKNLS